MPREQGSGDERPSRGSSTDEDDVLVFEGEELTHSPRFAARFVDWVRDRVR